MKNLLLDKFNSGKKVIGCWNTMSNFLTTEVLANSGFDYIILDFEHGPFDLKNISTYVSICERYQVTPIVRIASNQAWMTLQALDQGAHGVMCPQVMNSEDVKRFLDGCYYAPKGARGFTPFSKGGAFGDTLSYTKKANEQVLSSVIIETKEAVEDFDRIIEHTALNMVFFGTYDLSVAYGKNGDTRSPDVVDMIKQLSKKAKGKGIKTGGFLAQTEKDLDWINKFDFDFYLYSVDSLLLSQAARRGTDHFKKIQEL